jgi:hypothetical protein
MDLVKQIDIDIISTVWNSLYFQIPMNDSNVATYMLLLPLCSFKLSDSIEDLVSLKDGNGPQFNAFFTEYSMENEDMESRKMYKGVRIENRIDRRRTNPDDETEFSDVRTKFIENLVNNLNERFPHVELLHAMQVNES